MNFIGALNFYTKFIEKLNIILKPFYDLLHENTPWSWTTENETLFHKFKKTPSLLIQNLQYQIQKNPFFNTVDGSLIGLGAVLFHLKEAYEMNVIS